MVRKLFKHECLSYLRTFLPIQIILLSVALLGRIIQFFETDSVVYNIVNVSSIVVFIIAIFASLLLTTITCIVRFYKNLFSGEGYLSFTLPVTPTQHIGVKVLTAVLVNILTVCGILLSVCIITAGDVLGEVVKAAVYLINLLQVELGANSYHLGLYLAEFLLLLIIATFVEYLLFYVCIAVGQTFRKNRVLGAVGVYFGYYMATQVISTVLMVLFSVSYDWLPWQQIGLFIEQHPFAFIHLVFGVLILFYALMSTLWFFVTRWIIRRKLNLE